VKHLFVIFLILVLTACNYPRPITPTPPVTPTPSASPTGASGECAYVEARQPLPGLSGQFFDNLKQAGLPVDAARAEAYGENCVAADNSVVRFAAMETDLYITMSVTKLADEAALGGVLEKILVIIANIPADQLGPNPGYIGVTFKVADQVQNLWFSQTQAGEVQHQGLKGADLYRALTNKP
jgi:hypothetical protein